LLFGVPDVRSPMPESLAARAQDLVAATTELIERARTLSAEIAPQDRAMHPRHRIRAAASHFDLRA
jgi:hypothetical protein